ncbi:unnamed protein product [Caenorhabditis bovis]|uniref:GOLD domain-containing protein n=1 Tax=Caenorhabditis bovis TaxID=2654633 RepID=A0A8S1F575_9PELO|nr:unnamed protein product [Caenorhabditis bovis]
MRFAIFPLFLTFSPIFANENFKFLVNSNEEFCFFIDNAQQDTHKIHAMVLGSNNPVDVVVYDRDRNSFHTSPLETTHHFTLNVNYAALCFITPHHSTKVHLSVRKEQSQKGLNEIANEMLAKTNIIEDFMKVCLKIAYTLRDAQVQQKAHNMIEKQARTSSEELFERFNFWATINTLVMVFAVGAQVMFIRAMLGDHRLFEKTFSRFSSLEF